MTTDGEEGNIGKKRLNLFVRMKFLRMRGTGSGGAGGEQDFSPVLSVLVRPPCSVDDGGEQSHDGHAAENEQDLQERVSEEEKKRKE